MSAQNHGAPLSGSQNSFLDGGLTFKLANGDSGEISPEERKIYDHIIYCNIGTFPAAGLTGQYPVSRSLNRLMSLNSYR